MGFVSQLILLLVPLVKPMVIALSCNIVTSEQRNVLLSNKLASFVTQRLNVHMGQYAILIQQPVFRDALLIFQCLMERRSLVKIYGMIISHANQDFQNF